MFVTAVARRGGRWLCLATICLGGCSQLGNLEYSSEQRWQTHQLALEGVDHWHINARAALKFEGGAYNIGVSWQRDPDSSMLLLKAPFGQGVIRLSTDADHGYQLQLPDGQVFVNASPEALLESVIGWSLPIRGLEYWIRGLPHPQSRHLSQIDAFGRMRSIEQDRWEIDYLDYFRRAGAPPLPRRIELARDRLRLKLVIQDWQPVQIEDSSSDLFPEF